MGLKARLQDDLKAALLERRRFEVETLRGLKAEILAEEVKTGRRDDGIDDAEIEAIVAREIKKRLESAAVYTDGGRPELAETEQQQIDILKKYVPEPLDETAIRHEIDSVIARLGADSPAAMGQVIAAVKTSLGAAADGATIARLTKEALTQK